MIRSRQIGSLLVAAAVAAPIAAQNLPVPDDWTWRLDAEQKMAAGQDVADGEWRYVRMPPGWHITTTGQGAFLFPKDRVVSGRWGVEVELFLFPKPSDAPFGVVLEGRDAAPAGSQQLRFLMRRDGKAALVARNDGVDSMLVAWTGDTAVKAHGGDVEKYLLRVMHQAGRLTFAVNGREMLSMATGGEDHVAVPGLRVGPGLNLHLSRFDLITPLAPVPVRPDRR